MTKELTQERLKELIYYDPETGIFKRKNPVSNSKPITSLHSQGYIRFTVDRVFHYAHRLAWLYVYGEFPDGVIDHINRQKQDNRISNLRISDHSKNGHNSNLSRRNKTGYTGVTFSPFAGKYRSCLVKNRKRIHIGYFDTPEEAHFAYLQAKQKLYP